jgi:flagellar hook-length control protein FliK
MQVTSSLTPLLGASAPPEPLIAPPAPGSDFASLLRQSQPAPAPSAPLPTATAAPTPAPAPAAPDASAPAPQPQPQAADAPAVTTPPAPPSDTPARSTDKAKTPGPNRTPATKTATTNSADKAGKQAIDRDGGTPTTSANADPGLAAWLAQLHALAAAHAAPAADANADGAATAGSAAQGLEGADPKTIGADPQGDPATALATGADTDPSAFAGALAEAMPADRARNVRKTDAASDLPVGMAAPLAAPAGAGSHASAPAAVTVSTPVDAPDFPQALGVHLSLLAKEGVQHAELHLNPADMGPVSVQIALDGTQARIDFGADAAATRHAIEAGLPELASALRDAGLTLTGGGVSQHSRDQGNDTGADGSQRGARGTARADGGDSGAAPASAARRTVRLGGVDLYA